MATNEIDPKLPVEQREFRPGSATSETISSGEKMLARPETPRAKEFQPKRGESMAESISKFRLPTLRKPKPAIPIVKDEVTLKIEKVMEENVGDAYQRLSPIAKQEFKIKGEETALKIRELLSSTHVKAKKILSLILAWLRLLPGVNRFFLEQEAKIKTDKIIFLNKEKHPPSS